MTARLSIGRTLAVAGIVTAVAVPLSAGSAFADTKPHHPAPTQSASHHPAPTQSASHQPSPPMHNAGHHPKPISHHNKVSTLRTRTRDAHIQTSPTADRHSRTVSTLRMPGSKVAVTCYTNGARLKGSSIWFQTVAPARGYISSSEVARPAHPVSRCK
jgi:hypothetical protein